MTLTKRQAKKKCLKIWTYLQNHPEIRSKKYLPPRIYKSCCEPYIFRCPLCALYNNKYGDTCAGCPINAAYGHCLKSQPNHPYDKWVFNQNAREGAAEIVAIVKEWKV